MIIKIQLHNKYNTTIDTANTKIHVNTNTAQPQIPRYKIPKYKKYTEVEIQCNWLPVSTE